MSSLRQLAEAIPCGRCGAGTGAPCRTDGSRGGKPRTCLPHRERERPILAAWYAGQDDGMREGLRSVAWRNGRGARSASPHVPPADLEPLLLEVSRSWSLGLTLEDLRR